jgi:hypothetical protein
MNKKLLIPVALAAMFFQAQASAAVISDPGLLQVVEDFEGFDVLVTQGPQALGGGVQVVSSIDSTLGAVAVDLGENGVWGAGDKFAGIGDLSFTPGSFDYDGSMTFSWNTGAGGTGAVFSIYQEEGGSAEVLLEALAQGGAVLESTSLLINLADPLLYNAGVFAGFLRPGNDIYGLRVSGDGFVLDDLAVGVVPVPAALPLFLSGVAMLGLGLRRRQTA